jgi:hypothetical protein
VTTPEQNPLEALLAERKAGLNPLEALLEEQKRHSSGATGSYAPTTAAGRGYQTALLPLAAGAVEGTAQALYDAATFVPRLYGRQVPNIDFHRQVTGRLQEAAMLNEANAWDAAQSRIGQEAGQLAPALITGGMASVGQASASLVAGGLKAYLANSVAMSFFSASHLKASADRAGYQLKAGDYGRQMFQDAVGLAGGAVLGKVAGRYVQWLLRRPIGEHLNHFVSNSSVGALFGYVNPGEERSRNQAALEGAISMNLAGAYSSLFGDMTRSRTSRGQNLDMKLAAELLDEHAIDSPEAKFKKIEEGEVKLRQRQAQNWYENTVALNEYAGVKARPSHQRLMQEFPGLTKEEAIKVMGELEGPRAGETHGQAKPIIKGWVNESVRELAKERIVARLEQRGDWAKAQEARFRLGMMDPIDARRYESRERGKLPRESQISPDEAKLMVRQAADELRKIRLDQLSPERQTEGDIIQRQEFEKRAAQKREKPVMTVLPPDKATGVQPVVNARAPKPESARVVPPVEPKTMDTTGEDSQVKLYGESRGQQTRSVGPNAKLQDPYAKSEILRTELDQMEAELSGKAVYEGAHEIYRDQQETKRRAETPLPPLAPPERSRVPKPDEIAQADVAAAGEELRNRLIERGVAEPPPERPAPGEEPTAYEPGRRSGYPTRQERLETEQGRIDRRLGQQAGQRVGKGVGPDLKNPAKPQGPPPKPAGPPRLTLVRKPGPPPAQAPPAYQPPPPAPPPTGRYVEKGEMPIGAPGARESRAVAAARELLGPAASQAPERLRAAGERAERTEAEKQERKMARMSPQQRAEREAQVNAAEARGIERAQKRIEKALKSKPGQVGLAALATGAAAAAIAKTDDDDDKANISMALGVPAWILFGRGKLGPVESWAANNAAEAAGRAKGQLSRAEVEAEIKEILRPTENLVYKGTDTSPAFATEVMVDLAARVEALAKEDQAKPPADWKSAPARAGLFGATIGWIKRMGFSGQRIGEFVDHLNVNVAQRKEKYKSERDAQSTGPFGDKPWHEFSGSKEDSFNKIMDFISKPGRVPAPSKEEIAKALTDDGFRRRVAVQMEYRRGTGKKYTKSEEEWKTVQENVKFQEKFYKDRAEEWMKYQPDFVPRLNEMGRYESSILRDEIYDPPASLRFFNPIEFRRRQLIADSWQKAIADETGMSRKEIETALRRAQDHGGAFNAPIDDLIGDPIAGKSPFLDYHRMIDAGFGIHWDPVKQMNKYAVATDRRIEFAKIFGANGEIFGELRKLAYLEGHSARLLSELFDIATEQKTRYTSGFNSVFRQGLREVEAGISLGALGLSVLSQMTQHFSLAPRVQMTLGPRTKLLGTENRVNMLNAWVKGHRAAIAQSHVFPNWMKKSLGDESLARVIGLTAGSNRASHIVELAQRKGVFPTLLNTMLHVTGMQYMDRTNRNIATIAGMEMFRIKTKQLEVARQRGMAKEAKSIEAEIRELFEQPTHGEEAIKPLGKMSKGQFDYLEMQAGEFLARRINHRTDPTDMPPLFSDPLGRSLFTLATFSHRAAAEWWQQKKTFVHGNKTQRMRLVAGWGFQVLGGFLTLELMKRIRNKGLDDLDEDPLWRRLVEGAAYSGWAAPLFGAWETINMTHGNPARTAIPPVGLTALDMGDAILMSKKRQDSKPFFRQLVQTLYPTTPYSLLPGVPTKKQLKAKLSTKEQRKRKPYPAEGR